MHFGDESAAPYGMIRGAVLTETSLYLARIISPAAGTLQLQRFYEMAHCRTLLLACKI